MMTGIAAGIVTYNPDLDLLLKNINAVREQVDFIVIVDNGSKNADEIFSLTSNSTDLVIMNDKNLGIAMALNQIAGISSERGFDWVVTLDQDSIVPPGYIKAFSDFPKTEDIAVVCPRIHYANTSDSLENIGEKKFEQVKSCITSGALTNVPVLQRLGGFDSAMFIDLVDFEYSLRLGENGFRIIRFNEYVLMHRLGDTAERYIGKRKIYVTNHSRTRVYYYARNIIYCLRKHPKSLGVGFVVCDLFKKLIKLILFESNKVGKVASYIKGLRDGIFMKISGKDMRMNNR